MNRLIEYTVFSGFVTAWRFATCPTNRSPLLVIATTEGVVRVPSWLGITTGSPPCITATTEFVVPRSIPIILLIATVLVFTFYPKALMAVPPLLSACVAWKLRGWDPHRGLTPLETGPIYNLSVALSSCLIVCVRLFIVSTYCHPVGFLHSYSLDNLTRLR